MAIQPFHRMCALFLLSVILLPACGGEKGGAGSNSGPASSFPPVVPARASLSFARTRIFQINWTDVSDATYYRVLENPDGLSGYTQISGDIPAGTQLYEHYVNFPLYDSFNTSYILQSCNAQGCNDDNPVFVSSPAVLSDAIGYFISPDPTQTRNGFGQSVALSEDGNTLVVGASEEDSSSTGINNPPNNVVMAENSGAAFVFTRSGNSWAQQAYIKPSNTAAGDKFATSISLSDDGNTLVVGAPYDDSTANDSGAVYVFIRSGSSWTEQDYIKASNPGTGDHFGQSISLNGDGDTIAVGAPDEDGINPGLNQPPGDNGTADNSGAAYVFTRINNNWSQKDYIKASNVGAGDRFGSSVSLSSAGNTLAVGAPFEDGINPGFNQTPGDDGTADDSGAAYVFDLLNQQQLVYIKASNTGAGDNFGASVCVRTYNVNFTNVKLKLAIGAPKESSTSTGINSIPNNDRAGVGAVYIISSDDIRFSWDEKVYIKPDYILTNGQYRFGTSVSLNKEGDTLAVGAPYESSISGGINSIPEEIDALEGEQGAAYVFHRIGASWSQQAYLKAFNNVIIGYFGQSVDISGSGNALAIGAPSTSGLGTHINGDVYLY